MQLISEKKLASSSQEAESKARAMELELQGQVSGLQAKVAEQHRQKGALQTQVRVGVQRTLGALA